MRNKLIRPHIDMTSHPTSTHSTHTHQKQLLPMIE
jgi:hypothetical protein